MVNVLARIKKRDGTIADFNQDKITNAIFKSMQSQGVSDRSIAKTASDIVTFMLEEKFGGYTVPSVEQIQDIVEMVLMKQGYLEVAKSYILYREKHKGIREAKKTGLNLERLIRDYIGNADWKIRENSNEGVMSFAGLNARVSGEVLSTFALNQIYTERSKRAHEEGDLHIHDLSYPIVGYCAGWSLEKLIRKGFGHVPNQVHSNPAKHLDTLTLHMVNFIGLPSVERSVPPGFAPPRLRIASRTARPMVALARLPWPSAPSFMFIPMRSRIGPLMTSTGLAPMVVAITPWMLYSSVRMASTAAMITGMYSGLHPAITELIASFSIVTSPMFGGIRPSTS